MTKIPAGRSFELPEVEQFLRDKHIGPLEGFRSKAGWPFTAELRLVHDDELKNWKLEFDFGEDAQQAEEGEPVDFSGQESLGACPKCQGHVYEHGANYVCEHAVGAHVTCDFKSGKVILTQPVDRASSPSCWPPARPTCWRTSSPTRRAASSRPSWPTTRRKARWASSSSRGAQGAGQEGRAQDHRGRMRPLAAGIRRP
jgi:hypothetical protein